MYKYTVYISDTLHILSQYYNDLSNLKNASITDIVRAQGNNSDNPLVLAANSSGGTTVRVYVDSTYTNLGRIYVYPNSSSVIIGNNYSSGSGEGYYDISINAYNVSSSSVSCVFYVSLLLYKKGL